MPTLFDSHAEFNEWFSKDIEGRSDKKTGISESESATPCHKHHTTRLLHLVTCTPRPLHVFDYVPSMFYTGQLSRLHMILKPFMLRRCKVDVENEMAKKV